jgi:subtilisin family serine protease
MFARLFVCLFILLNCCTLTFSQNYYFVKFKNKAGTEFSLSNPQEYLSQKAIQRRINQHVNIDSLDLPVSQKYLQTLKNLQADVIYTSKWLNGATVLLSDTVIVAAIENLPFVKNVKCLKRVLINQLLPVNQSYNPYDSVLLANYRQNQMIGVNMLHRAGFRGAGKTIAVLDAGFLGADSIKAFDSIQGRIFDTYNFVDMEKNVYKHHQHGTLVLSTIAGNIHNQYLGTAPDASFLLYLTEDDKSETMLEMANWIIAAERADSAGADVITSSLGYYRFDGGDTLSYSDLDGHSTMISQAATIAARKGILVCNSAGNEGNKTWKHIIAPADADSIISVGSVDYYRQYSTFSSQGPTYDGRIKPTLAAQGANAVVINPANHIFESSGTSYSCPIIAGAATSLWSALPNLTNMELIQNIIQSASQYRNPDNYIGYGIPNVWNAYKNYVAKIDDNNFSVEFNGNLLDVKSCVSVNYQLFLYDISGIMLFSTQAYGNSNFYCSNIGKGIYIVQIYSRLGNFCKKIVK